MKCPKKYKCNVIEEAENAKIEYCILCRDTVDLTKNRQINTEHMSYPVEAKY